MSVRPAILARIAAASLWQLSPAAGLAQSGPQVAAVPATVQQGQSVEVRIGGFAPDSLMTISLDGARVSQAGDYSDSQGAFDKRIAVPSSLADGPHQIVVTDVYGDRASTTLQLGGAYAPATLAIRPRAGRAGQELELVGDNWQRRPKTVTLDGPGGWSRTLDSADNCLLTGSLDDPSKDVGCTLGALHLLAQIPPDAPAGLYVLTVSDGLGQASADFRVTGPSVRPPPGPPQVPQPPPNLPPQQQGGGCNPNVPLYAQPACGDGQTSQTGPLAGPDTPTPTPNLPALPQSGGCNPNVPLYAQPGCAAAGTSAGPPAPVPAPPPAPAQGACNPDIPRYAQPGCS